MPPHTSQRYALTTPLINVMTSAAEKATRYILRDFGEADQLQVSHKGAMDFVTTTDRKVEQLLREQLSKARPDFGFLMEESGEVKGKNSQMRWIIDPIDGTTNFMHAIPYFCVSIALEKRLPGGSEIIAAVTYDPLHDEMFMAEQGAGAFLNQRRLRVSNRETNFYFVTGTSRRRGQHSAECSRLADKADGMDAVIRRSGAAALDLAYVAAGRYDAAWFPKLKEWDMAGGMLLIREAGGIICLPDGRDGDPLTEHCIFAGSTPAHKAMMQR